MREQIDKEVKEGKRKAPENERQANRLKVLDWTSKDCSRAQINPVKSNARAAHLPRSA
jgi:hypothetical protein